MAEELIRISIVDKSLRNSLDKLSKRMRNLRPVMKKIAGIMHDAVEENFEREGRPKWKSLSQSTIKQRKKKGHWPGQILQVSGSLATSITQAFDNNSAAVGTNKPYAAIHQFGGMAGRGKSVEIPARPFLRLADDDLEEIKEAVKGYLKKG